MTGLRLTRAARERYAISAAELPGQVSELRALVAQIQASGEAGRLATVHAGHLEAAWLIGAAISLVVDRYRDEIGRDALDGALLAVEADLDRETIEALLSA